MASEQSHLGVSVIMPAYNAGRTIKRSIESVLAQTHQKLELIIIDDCSSDNTREIINQYVMKDARVHLLVNEHNVGVSHSRNRGIRNAQYPWIALLDSDDTWDDQKLEKQLLAIQSTGASLCYTSYALVNPEGAKVRFDYIVPVDTNFKSLLKENVIGCSTVLVSTELLKTHSFQSEFYHEDYVLWLEILREGYLAVGCPEVLTNWCYRVDSRSYRKGKSLKKRWDIYRNCERLPFFRSVYYLICYSVAGIRKYRGGIHGKRNNDS